MILPLAQFNSISVSISFSKYWIYATQNAAGKYKNGGEQRIQYNIMVCQEKNRALFLHRVPVCPLLETHRGRKVLVGQEILDNMEHWERNSACFQTKPQKWLLVNCCLTFLYGTYRLSQSKWEFRTSLYIIMFFKLSFLLVPPTYRHGRLRLSINVMTLWYVLSRWFRE